MKKELKVTYPYITYEPEYAYKLSIILNNENGLKWFVNNLIGVFGFLLEGNYIEFKFDNLWETDLCPLLLQHGTRYDSPVNKQRNNSSEFIIDAIDSDYYLEITVDTFYMKDSPNYNSVHSLHPAFIYGYNKNNETFNYGEFYKYGKYSFGMVSFQDIEKAMKNSKNVKQEPWRLPQGIPNDNCFLYQKKDIIYDFRIYTLIKQVEDYYLSKEIKNGEILAYNFPVFKKNKNKIMYSGISIYRLLEKYLDTIYSDPSEEPDSSNAKAFSFLRDHKHAMVVRMRYLESMGYLRNGSDSINKFENIYINSRILLNLYIKYVITGKIYLMSRMKDIAGQMEAEERAAIEILLEELKDSNIN